MKAIIRRQYGSPDVLALEDVENPAPQDNEVLVKVHAVSLNASDWELLTGSPLYARIFGFFTPKYKTLGSDIAGRIEAVGANVTGFKPGDAVYGDLMGYFGGFAEYLCAPASKLTLKPAAMTFDVASALPQAACIALQGIRDVGKLQRGQKVLINGAGGGSGMFAIQLAKNLGAEVTGVDNSLKQDVMRSFGADHVIDYTKEDFTRNGKAYDLILDLAAFHSVSDYKRALSPTGTYLMVGGSTGLMIQILTLESWMPMFGGKKLRILGVEPNKDLDLIAELVQSGEVTLTTDRRYPLEQVADALRYFGEGRAKGKIIITLNDEDQA